jgi:hypothetical protein
MNQSNRRLLIKAADLVVTQAALLTALEESTKINDTVNLQTGLAYTAHVKRAKPILDKLAATGAESSDNEIFKVLRELLEGIAAPESVTLTK